MEAALWSLFHKGNDLIHEAAPLNVITPGISFHCINWQGQIFNHGTWVHDRFITVVFPVLLLSLFLTSSSLLHPPPRLLFPILFPLLFPSSSPFLPLISLSLFPPPFSHSPVFLLLFPIIFPFSSLLPPSPLPLPFFLFLINIIVFFYL